MPEPWFDPMWFGILFGAIGGSLLGTAGGILGGLAGYLAPRGKGRGFVLGGFVLMIAVGLACLAFGLAALVSGQPYAIWFFPLLCGIIGTLVFGALLPVVRARYRQADERRIAAAGLRAE
jgi:hypothetical protein